MLFCANLFFNPTLEALNRCIAISRSGHRFHHEEIDSLDLDFCFLKTWSRRVACSFSICFCRLSLASWCLTSTVSVRFSKERLLFIFSHRIPRSLCRLFLEYFLHWNCDCHYGNRYVWPLFCVLRRDLGAASLH